MMEYMKYIILILLGVVIANIWFYIRRLEFENEMLVKAVETKLIQFKNQSSGELDDTN